MLRWIVRVGRRIIKVKPADTKEDDESTISGEIGDDLADTSDEGDKDDSESCVEWIRKSTSIAEGILKETKAEDWICRTKALEVQVGWPCGETKRRTLIVQGIVLEARRWQAGE